MALLLSALCIGLYARTVDYPMQFDSVMYLRDNPMLRDAGTFPYPSDLRAFFRLPQKHAVDSDLATNIVTRPLTYATFYWNWCFDDYNPRWYHVVNIGIHLVNSALVYALALAMFKGRESRWWIAIMASALFAVHPMAIESVTYIVQRLTSLMTMFFLTAVWLHLMATDTVDKRRRRLWQAVSVVCMVCASLSKECAVMAPIMAIMLDRVRSREAWKVVVKRALPLLVCLPVVPALLMAASWGHYGTLGLGDVINLVNNKEEPVSHWHYVLTEFTVLVHYLRMLFWPSGQSIDPEWPFYRTLFSGPVLGSLTLIVVLLAAAWQLHRRQWLGFRSSVIAVFVCWFFGTIAISSGIAPLPDAVAEHRTYLPSVGFFIALAGVVDWLRQTMSSRGGWRWLVPSAFGAAVCALTVVNWQRNEVWSTELGLWQDAAAKGPGKFRVWGNLAGVHASRGELAEALECCDKALSIEPRFGNPSILKATILNSQRRYQEARDETERLIATDKRALLHPDVRYNLGVALFGLNRLDESEKVLKENLARMPSHWASRVGLGLISRKRKQMDEALSHFRAAAEICPDKEGIERLIAQTLAKAGRSPVP